VARIDETHLQPVHVCGIGRAEVGRINVLGQGAASLSRMDDVRLPRPEARRRRRRRFEFVHNAELRPVPQQTFADSRDALERGEFALALILSCGVIETRIAAAESAGLIRNGCARLPPSGAPRRHARPGSRPLIPVKSSVSSR
jgi:hypothetical protein